MGLREGSIHQHKLAGRSNNMQLEHAWALTCIIVVPMCKLHAVAASCSNLRRWMLVPGPPDLSNLRWWCFSFQQLAQTLYMWRLPSATCTYGLFPSCTGAYTGGGGVGGVGGVGGCEIYVVVAGAYGNAGGM